MNKKFIDGLLDLYYPVQSEIQERLHHFSNVWKTGTEEEIFCEMVFCLLTPQSKAKLCWNTVEQLKQKNLLFCCDPEKLSEEIRLVRFKNKKAVYIIHAREIFTINNQIAIKNQLPIHGDIQYSREWLVKNIKGYGYKEASHFLRNIGFGEQLGILDRHILKNLVYSGVIPSVSRNLSKTKYLEIERQFKTLAKAMNIPMSHLDILLWFKETREIFK